MALYGLSLWGKEFYGADTVASYSVGAVSATQTGYGEITLRWDTPIDSGTWSTLRLVRNTAGFPSVEDDGDVLLELTPGQAQNTFTDSGLTGGRFYYYTFFLASAFPAYSGTTTYQPGDTVSYSGSAWVCTAANTVSVTPAPGANWTATNALSLWNTGGRAVSLAVADFGYRTRLRELTPTVYASSQTELSAPLGDDPTPMDRYLAVLAWALDMARTELGEEEHLSRTDTMPIGRMEHLAAQLGTPAEASITPRLRRYRVANSAELSRRRGTLESIRDAIYAATGYDAGFSTSANRMLDADQTEFRYPRYAAWDPSVTYAPGDVVSYNGYLYSALPSAVKIEAESTTVSLNGAPSSIIQGNVTGATYSNNQQVLVRSNAAGQGATLTFSIPTTGMYDLSMAVTHSYDYAITEFAVDGTQILSGRVLPTSPPTFLPLVYDGYAASPAPASSVYLGAFNLTAGDHTIKVTANSKNAHSGTTISSQNNGYQIGVDYITYVPTAATHITGIAPPGTATSNSFWTYYTAVQTNALDNALTGGISTWEQVSFTVGANASNASLAEYSGYFPLNGVGDHTSNLAVMTNGTGMTATLGVHSIPHAKISAWDSTTVYRLGSYVSYNGVNYLAVLPTQGNQPDADLAHWRPEVISTTGVDRFLVSSYGTPLARTPTWSAGAVYSTGDLVEYQGQRYTASASSQGIAPTGHPTDNSVWAWVDSAIDVYTASAWTSLFGGSSTGSRSLYIEWYDANGALITSISPTPNTAADLLVPFARNSSDLAADTGSAVDTNGLLWANPSTDTPAASSGIAYWATRNDASLTGRHLVINYSQADISAGITFMTQPPSAVEHGLLFRWSSKSNFWAASRTRLTKTVGGTLTVVASWAALPDGARLFVNVQGSAIAVYAYQGPGLAPVQLASVTDSALNTATRYGIFERAI